VKNKIAEIDFIGNEKLSDKTLRKAMKDTKEKLLRILKASKFIKAKYKTDLEKCSYKERKDIEMQEYFLIPLLILKMKTHCLSKLIEEGNKYYFGEQVLEHCLSRSITK
jgi:outer membrane protein insertion porin family